MFRTLVAQNFPQNMHSYFIVGVLLFCHNLIGDSMTEYVDRLCRLGIPACSAVMIVQDFLKNFGTIALDELLDAVQVYNPKLYKSFLRKL